MKIALIGASGHAGSEILKEAVDRGLDVTAVVRNKGKLKLDVPTIEKDLFTLTKDDLAPFDVIVDAFNAPAGKETLHQDSIQHLVDLLQGSGKRLIVVGGASSLFLDADRTNRMIDGVAPDAPFYPTAHNMWLGLKDLLDSHDLDWTYLSPAAYFNPNGAKTGEFKLSDDRMIHNHAGKSEVSMGNYAIALVDEIENPQHIQQHFSVVDA